MTATRSNAFPPPSSAFTATEEASVRALVSRDGNLYGRSAAMSLLKIVTLGASITNGSSATNAGTTAYSPLIGSTGNQAKWIKQVPYFGYPGQKATYIVDQVATALAENPDILILGPDFGTNGAADADADLSAAYIQPLLAVYAACRAAGVTMLACLTLPQGSGQTDAATHRGIRKQNVWLSTTAPKLGIGVIDTHSPVLDNATGYLSASLHSDNIHPNDTGHALIAAAIVAHLNTAITAKPWPVGGGACGLNLNPLMVGVGTTPDSWTVTVSPSTFAGTRTNALEARVDATDLPVGRWYKVICDASVSGAGALRTGTFTFNVTAGEKLLFLGWLKATGAGVVSAEIWNVQTSASAGRLALATNGAASVPFASIVTVPAGCTSMRLALQISTSAGQTATGYIGACDVIRPGDLGLTF